MLDSINPFVIAIPFVAAFIGWFTNWLAVRALLYPVEFIGIPPIFGWQGVMPKNAEQMSLSFSKMIREKLIDFEIIFQDMKSDDNEKLNQLVDDVTEKVIDEFSTNIAPDSWQRAREKLREYITQLVRKNVRDVVHGIMDRLIDEVDDIIDIDDIMQKTMVEERALMGEVLCEIADKEFTFIEKSGLYFGFIFGVIQMFVWLIYPKYWVLPAAGFFVGYATNWMAMNLIFEPKEPKKIGPFTIQGVFIKRQYEVAEKFARVICDNVLHAKNMVKYIGQEKSKTKLLALIDEQVSASMAIYEKDAMVGMLASKEKLSEARETMQARVRDMDFDEGLEASNSIYTLMDQGPAMKQQIIMNLRKMDPTEFSSILRPVFQKDEWKLLVVGGVIGVAIGALQYSYFFSGAW